MPEAHLSFREGNFHPRNTPESSLIDLKNTKNTPDQPFYLENLYNFCKVLESRDDDVIVPKEATFSPTLGPKIALQLNQNITTRVPSSLSQYNSYDDTVFSQSVRKLLFQRDLPVSYRGHSIFYRDHSIFYRELSIFYRELNVILIITIIRIQIL